MNDNWGSAARIGIFVVGNEVVPEAEWWAMAPPGVSVHAARVSAPAPWATWGGDRTAVVLVPDLERGARQFAGMRLSVVVVAHTSSSVVGGAGWDEAIVAALTPHVGTQTHVTTNGLDCIAALKALGVVRPFVVLPPWFDDAFGREALQYLGRRELAPTGHLIHSVEEKWRAFRPRDLYGAFMHVEQRLDRLLEEIVRSCPPAADSVLIGGTGFRCVGLIDELENRLRRPVVTANQAGLWNALRLAGVRRPIEGYGTLLRS